VRKGIIQPTYKGRQWRHGVVYWAFMLAGLIGRPDDDDDGPIAPALPRRRRLRNYSEAGGRGSSAGSSPRKSPRQSRSIDGHDSPLPLTDATDDTDSDGAEKAGKADVNNPLLHEDEFKTVFKGKDLHEAVLEVVCRLARLMGKLCGDNAVPGAMSTEQDAAELQQEAKVLVTRFVRVLFGAVSTTKMHRLAFHLMQELLLRGNLEDADTSTNEMLHKLLKAMYRVTNKHPANFEVQMMRCEQTLLHILTEDAGDKLKDLERDAAADELSATNKRRSRRRARKSNSARSGATCGVADYENGYDASDESDEVGRGSGRQDRIEGAAHRHAHQVAESTTDGTTSDDVDDSGFETCTSDEGDDGVLSTQDDDDAEDAYHSVNDGMQMFASGSCHTKRYAEAGSASIGVKSRAAHSASSSVSYSSGICSGDSTQSGATASGTSGVSTTSTSTSSSTSHATGSGSSTHDSLNEPRPVSRCGKRRSAKPLMPGRAPLPKRRRTVEDTMGRGSASIKRVRVRGMRLSVAAAAAADGGRLRQLPELLGLVDTQMLTVVNSMAFTASFEWGAEGFGQRVRASRSLYNGTPWWDHVLFEDGLARRTMGPTAPTQPSLGLARLLIRAVDGVRCDLVVVQLLEDAAARRGCVLTEFGCGRRRWKMHPTTGFPSIAVVPLARLQRLEHVVPDFEDLCDRLGLYATPATVPDSPHELHLQRYFVNAFFPWTGGEANHPK